MMSSIDSTTKRKPSDPRRGPLPRGPQRTLEEVRAEEARRARERHEKARIRALEQEEVAVAGQIAREREAARLAAEGKSLRDAVSKAIHDTERDDH